MVKNTSRNAIRMDRAVPAAHGRTGLLASCATDTAAITGTTSPKFVGVLPYVANQESHPPRGHSPV